MELELRWWQLCPNLWLRFDSAGDDSGLGDIESGVRELGLWQTHCDTAMETDLVRGHKGGQHCQCSCFVAVLRWRKMVQFEEFARVAAIPRALPIRESRSLLYGDFGCFCMVIMSKSSSSQRVSWILLETLW